jgi:hypothetical protein
MGKIRIVTGVLALLLVGVLEAPAQQVTGSAELDAAVVTRAEAVEQQREELRSLLQRPEVREVAEKHNVDLERVEGGLGTLSAADLDRLAPVVQSVTGDLAGGQVLTITTTTIILILLLVILLVLIT